MPLFLCTTFAKAGRVCYARPEDRATLARNGVAVRGARHPRAETLLGCVAFTKRGAKQMKLSV